MEEEALKISEEVLCMDAVSAQSALLKIQFLTEQLIGRTDWCSEQIGYEILRCTEVLVAMTPLSALTSVVAASVVED
ncbi:hypothetical protein JANAI62_37330 [Jannaschia pagri]|uniref:Uncharacterized protein n=1 Tax=Jannaschia pagri TaxID=2829797 RepID=A0ABQ4NS45_9RHOB|nr:hypothetical protein JANAI61_37740 [Jannaschia sp. AI_61]GIT97110.1 hypothetical protein JANAI62_37330 [Jannaschia sp. AI_62]